MTPHKQPFYLIVSPLQLGKGYHLCLIASVCERERGFFSPSLRVNNQQQAEQGPSDLAWI